jgi:hypothetical protein
VNDLREPLREPTGYELPRRCRLRCGTGAGRTLRECGGGGREEKKAGDGLRTSAYCYWNQRAMSSRTSTDVQYRKRIPTTALLTVSHVYLRRQSLIPGLCGRSLRRWSTSVSFHAAFRAERFGRCLDTTLQCLLDAQLLLFRAPFFSGFCEQDERRTTGTPSTFT